MQIKFQEDKKELIDSIKNVNLHELFDMITYGAKDADAKKHINTALMLFDVYIQNYGNYESKYPPKPKAIEYASKENKKKDKNVKLSEKN